MLDRYGPDALSTPARRPASRMVPADVGLVVEEVTTGWVGAVVGVEASGGMRVVVLEDRQGRTRTFPLGPGFWIDGQPVELIQPVTTTPPVRKARTASGSVAVEGLRARVARSSRIWVEGRHDAELVEKVWGDDLRIEGVVVEMLDGVDRLADAVADFAPSPDRRIGVLLDHLVTGAKETRIAADVARSVPPGALLVVGHPYVDVWQAVRPERVGLSAWPTVDRSVEWKRGVLDHLGWPSATQTDVANGWRRIVGTVRDFRDLEPAFLGRVEELIDFVTR